MKKPTLAIFCMPERGHFTQIRPLIGDLTRAGFGVHVFSHAMFEADVARAGACFIDIFADHPLAGADSQSLPLPCRYVTYAGTYAQEIIARVRAVKPALIIAEAFSVVARVAAQALGIPFLNAMTGHNVDPARYIPALSIDPHLAISDRCHRAVELLRERYGLADASPFSFLTGFSQLLNICCEPPDFLSAAERKVFEPIAFYGCIPSEEPRAHMASADIAHLKAAPAGQAIYACFGTLAFHLYPEAAYGALGALADCLVLRPQARLLVSLGGAGQSERSRKLARPNLRIVEYTDQWAALGAADVFVTHQGMNSTHEAIAQRVPMLSYPFFWDQPQLAKRCEALGIALPLTRITRAPLSAENIEAGFRQLAENREAMAANLERAAGWERAVIANRASVLRQIAAFAKAA